MPKTLSARGPRAASRNRSGVSRTAVALLLAVSASLAGCAADPGRAGEGGAVTPHQGGILRTAIADTSTVDSLDPAVAFSGTASWLSSMIYSPLVRMGLDSTLQANVASEWMSNEDATEWTFELRDDVRFHDGTALTAEDVAWTVSRLLDEDVASSVRSRLAPSLEEDGIVVVDDDTIRFDLTTPNAFLPEALSVWNAGIVKAGQSEFDLETAAGTGPFKIKSFVPGTSFEVVRNDEYFVDGQPLLDGIQNSRVDSSTVLQALSSGAIDWTDALPPKSVVQLDGDPRFVVPALEGDLRSVRAYFLHMNLTMEPFDDPRVVEAFKLATDRDAIRQAVLGTLGSTSADVPVPTDDPAYPDTIGAGDQDIERAKQLLAEAGYPDGIDVDLPTAEIQPGMVDFSVAFAETAREAGIRINVQQVPIETYFDRVFGQVSLFHDYGLRDSAYTMLSAFFAKGGPYNGTGFDEDGALSAYLASARAESDIDARTEILREALVYTAENSGTIVPFFVPIVSTARAGVHADIYSPIFSWETVWIE